MILLNTSIYMLPGGCVAGWPGSQVAGWPGGRVAGRPEQQTMLGGYYLLFKALAVEIMRTPFVFL